ncbi:MAG: glycosyltransferase family 39 protein [Planctomycetota bacterium]|nr:glycosyltransferase family 39 protein [Planctomycetota bacterium]
MIKGPILIALVCLLVGIPFLGQAYTIDGPTFVAVAMHLRHNPTAILSFSYDHLGERVDGYILEMTHPPLWPYLLAGTYALAGSDSEVAAHLLTLLFAVLAGVSLFFIAERFRLPSLVAGLLLIAAPPFLVLSHTVMAEVPALGFSLLGTWLFLRYKERPTWGRGALASIPLACAIGVAYQAIPVLIVLALFSPRSRWIPLLLPAAAILAWWILPWLAGAGSPLASGLFPYASTVGSNPWTWIPIKAACLFAYLGLCPAFLVAAASRLNSRSGIIVALLLLGMGAGIYHWAEPTPGALGTFIFAILFAGGGGATILVSLPAREQDPWPNFPRRLFLGWFWGYVLFNMFVLNFAAARHAVILIPPMILLLLRRAPGPLSHPGTVAASLVVGLLLSTADYRFARGSATLPPGSTAPSPWTGKPPYFSGEWSFRHYREKEGFKYLLPEVEAPEAGDRVVVPLETGHISLPQELLPRLTLVDEIPIPDPFPLRINHSQARAGFYNHAWGLLPFAISTEPLETLRVYEVNWFLSNLDRARIPRENGTNAIAPRQVYVEVGGRPRWGILIHPPGEIGFTFVPPSGARLEFAAGIADEASRQGGDGAEIRIEVHRRGKRIGEVFKKTIELRPGEERVGWTESEADLSPWAGEEIELVFKTAGGAAGDLALDWIVVADLRLHAPLVGEDGGRESSDD